MGRTASRPALAPPKGSPAASCWAFWLAIVLLSAAFCVLSVPTCDWVSLNCDCKVLFAASWFVMKVRRFATVPEIAGAAPATVESVFMMSVMFGMIEKLTVFEVAAGDGFETAIVAEPTAAMSVARMAAVTCVVPTNVVARAAPFHITVEPVVNPLPVTVRVNAGPPTVAPDGATDPIAGTKGNGWMFIPVEMPIKILFFGHEILLRVPTTRPSAPFVACACLSLCAGERRRAKKGPTAPPSRIQCGNPSLTSRTPTMPLVADNIEQARSAYAALETRAVTAETHVATLQASLQTLQAVVPTLVDRNNVLTQYTVGQVQQNSQLVSQQAQQSLARYPARRLHRFAGPCPPRSPNPPCRIARWVSLASTVQCFLSLSAPAADGSRSVGLRFYQPELGAPTSLAPTSFEIAKVPNHTGTSTPRTLYTVLADKQSLYADSFWTPFTGGTPAVAPATQIVIESSEMLASVSSWTFAFNMQESGKIAAFEANLATRRGSGATAAAAAPFAAAVAALAALLKRLTGNTAAPVAGDLYALSAALDLTTKTAALIP